MIEIEVVIRGSTLVVRFSFHFVFSSSNKNTSKTFTVLSKKQDVEASLGWRLEGRHWVLFTFFYFCMYVCKLLSRVFLRI